MPVAEVVSSNPAGTLSLARRSLDSSWFGFASAAATAVASTQQRPDLITDADAVNGRDFTRRPRASKTPAGSASCEPYGDLLSRDAEASPPSSGASEVDSG